MPDARARHGSSLAISGEVADALARGGPVVALESTLIAHGLPRPRNLEVAIELEEQLRRTGVTPATVGVVAGVPTVGLAPAQLELMATSDSVTKAGVRDLPVAAACGRDAATTVASTAWLAHRAGVRVFATGGLGGVHRGAAESFDESADLSTLARTPVTVVCAGVKSILDVGATLERLETLGVTVCGYQTDTFPGFYLTSAGYPLDWRLDEPAAVVAAMSAADSLDQDAGLVIANPVPADEQLDPGTHDRVLTAALEAAAEQGVHGKPVTPFLLDYFQRATAGASLEVNIRVVRNNVRLAAEIARAWASNTGGM